MSDPAHDGNPLQRHPAWRAASLIPGVEEAHLERQAQQRGRDDSATVFAPAVVRIPFSVLHFGGFHFGHSLFLTFLFPLLPPTDFAFGEHYLKVLQTCWPWLLAAACAEHRLFVDAPVVGLARYTADRARRPQKLFGLDPMAAYRNVLRMHLLLIAAVPLWHAGVPGFVLYLLVYTVYFWPRRWWLAAATR